VGEIWARGSSIAMGYNGLPNLTSEVFGISPAGKDEPVWLRTGDLGFLYKDELFITGRLKDLIIIRGRNFYPQDLEKTIEESHSSIRKTCSVAFSIELNGEEKLVVIAELKRSLFHPDTDKIMEAIVAAIFREFEIMPARVVLIRTGSLQKTSSGKIMRRAMRESFLSGKLEIVAEHFFEDREFMPLDKEGLETPGLEEFLVNWASLHLNNGMPVDPDNSLATYGMDSLRAMELADDTKNMFGFEWPPYLFFEEISIRKMAEEGSKLLEGM
jgi:acyl carrier protein